MFEIDIQSNNVDILHLFGRKTQRDIDISVEFCYNIIHYQNCFILKRSVTDVINNWDLLSFDIRIYIETRSCQYGKKSIPKFIEMEK